MKKSICSALLLLIVLSNYLYSQSYDFVLNTVGHTSTISKLIFTPDGKKIISGSHDKTIRIWDIESQKQSKVIWNNFDEEPKSGAVYSLALSPNGNTLAIAGNTPDIQLQSNTISLVNLRTNKKIALLVGHKDYICDVKFSPNGEWLTSCGTDKKIIIWKVNDLSLDSCTIIKPHSILTGHTEIVNSIEILNNGNTIYSVSSDKTIRKWVTTNNFYNNYQVKIIYEGKYPLYKLSISKNEKFIAITGLDDKIRILNPKGKLQKEFGDTFWGDNDVCFLPDNKTILVASNEYGRVTKYSISDGKELNTFKFNTNTVTALALYYIENNPKIWIASAGGNFNEIIVFNDNSTEPLCQFSNNSSPIWNIGVDKNYNIAYSENNRHEHSWFILNSLDRNTGINKKGDLKKVFKICNFRVRENVINPETYHRARDEFFSNTLTSLNNKELVLNDRLKITSYPKNHISCFSFTRKGNIVLGTNNSLEVHKLPYHSSRRVNYSELLEQKIADHIKKFNGHNGSITSVTVSNDGNYLISTGSDRTIRFWDLNNRGTLKYNSIDAFKQKLLTEFTKPELQDYLNEIGFTIEKLFEYNNWNEVKPKISLYINNDSEWIFWLPNGYYYCSRNAHDLAGWVINKSNTELPQFYSSDLLFQRYYQPDLIRNAINTMQNNIQEESNYGLTQNKFINDLIDKPEISLECNSENIESNGFSSKKEIIVKVKVLSASKDIKTINLYQNKKLINNSNRGFKYIDKSKKEFSFTLSLSNGNNEIKAIAIDEGLVESEPVKINIKYAGIEQKPNLFIIAIGINEYKNPKYSLNYAVADAKGIADEINRHSPQLYNSCKVSLLSNEEANRDNILELFDMHIKETKEQDVFVFYFAGHGVINDAPNQQYYILPFDVTQMYGDNKLLNTKGISAQELQSLSQNIKAQKQLFILDACQSGGMVESLVLRGTTEEKAIAQLARSTGTYWLTASGSEQFATEFESLGHGVFTYAILQGLKGEADGGEGDKKITVKEISSFLNDRVPELSEKYKGQAQYPTSYGYGQDFPIVIIKE